MTITCGTTLQQMDEGQHGGSCTGRLRYNALHVRHRLLSPRLPIAKEGRSGRVGASVFDFL